MILLYRGKQRELPTWHPASAIHRLASNLSLICQFPLLLKRFVFGNSIFHPSCCLIWQFPHLFFLLRCRVFFLFFINLLLLILFLLLLFLLLLLLILLL